MIKGSDGNDFWVAPVIHGLNNLFLNINCTTLFQGEGEDGEKEPEEIPETRIEVEIPKINTKITKNLHFVKLPNFLSVETR